MATGRFIKRAAQKTSLVGQMASRRRAYALGSSLSFLAHILAVHPDPTYIPALAVASPNTPGVY